MIRLVTTATVHLRHGSDLRALYGALDRRLPSAARVPGWALGLLELRDHGVYDFSIMMRTPFAGETVIARARGEGFDLFTVEEGERWLRRVSGWTRTAALSSTVGQRGTAPTCWWIRAVPLIR